MRNGHPQFVASLLALISSSFILHPSSFVSAEDEAPPKPPPGMRITFLPPPMDGTLSLGIYDKKGKLVRVMAREATPKDFIIGLNGLTTYWDGKDDSGKVMPPGVYYARGYSVGAIDVDGVGYHGNDWITEDDSPRLRRILPGSNYIGISVGPTLSVELTNGNHAQLIFAPQGVPQEKPFLEEKPKSPSAGENPGLDADPNTRGLPAGYNWFAIGDDAFAYGEGKLLRRAAPGKWEPAGYKDLHHVIFAALGDRPGVWVIDRVDERTEVKEYSFDGELLRRLAVSPQDPQPREVADRADVDLYLLEENSKEQRARLLHHDETDKSRLADGVSVWKTTASKTIHFSDTFDQARDLLHQPDGKPFKPETEFVVNLIENPLTKSEPTTAHVTIGFNDQGSFLETTDGLPLRRVTETPGLKWAVIGREGSGKQLTIFQSDGAVIEEFKAKRLAVMMAFDAGDYEWTGK